MRRNDDNTSLDGCAAIGQRGTRGDAGGNVEGEEAFATTMIAIEKCNA
jgi:hypothetical protein